jgi:hypothetical protein
MICTKCKKNKNQCGCVKGISTPAVCTNSLPACPNPDPCSETFNAACIVYMGDDIVDLDIKKGDRIDKVIQKLVLAITNPGCVLPTTACNAVLGLATTSITSSIIQLSWMVALGAVNYSVEYKEVSSPTWIINPIVGPTITNDYISGLIPSTEYHIRVNTICASGNCYSVTLKVKTKAV